jgi:CelD/BcsL family acetyltransferase involved in cellulose biosynthesis
VSALTLEEVRDLEELREDWSALGESSGNLFSTWEWASTWWRHLGEGRPLVLRRCVAGGRTVAILPLYAAAKRPARTLRFLGHDAADRCGLICAPDDRERAAGCLEQALAARVGRWQLFVADRVPVSEGWERLVRGQVVNRESSPTLRTAGRTWDEFLAERSRNFREQARRRERKLAREHDIGFRLTEDPGRLEHDMDLLIRLHRARWGESSRSFAGRLEAFHHDFARAALGRGWLRLWTLEADGAPVAAWYGFRFAGVEWYYQAGRDPSWDDRSVGFVMLVHTIREAFHAGVSEYRLLRGGEEYKDRFANADDPIDTLVLARGARGRAALAAATRARRMPRRLRRRMIRLAG